MREIVGWAGIFLPEIVAHNSSGKNLRRWPGAEFGYSTSPANDRTLRYPYKCHTSYKLPIYEIILRILWVNIRSLLIHKVDVI
jgi:hypothetical protein